MQLIKPRSFLLLLSLLIISSEVRAKCKHNIATWVTVPLQQIRVVENALEGSVLATYEDSAFNSPRSSIECDSEGGTLKYRSELTSCPPDQSKCYLRLRDTENNLIPGIGVQVTVGGREINVNQEDGLALTPMSTTPYKNLYPIRIQFIKIGPIPIQTTIRSQIVLSLELEKGAVLASYRLNYIDVIVENQCTLTFPSQVSLGTMSTAQLQKADANPGVPFTLNFTNCPSKLVKLTIQSPNPFSTEQGILNNVASNNAAKNVGVQILKLPSTQPFQLNRAETVGSSASFSVHLGARMYPTEGPISVGQVKAAATLVTSYE